MKRLLAATIASLLLLPVAARASGVVRTPDPVTVMMHGSGEGPRTIVFSQLPPVSNVPYTGPLTEVRDEGIWAEAEAELERQKAHPQAVDLTALGAQLTIDYGNGLSPLAPTAGNGFEGITQGSYIPSEPTCAAGPLNVFSTGNSNVTVTNKDGTSRVEANGAAFFGVTAGEGAISDAQCYYDAVHGRFVAVAFTTGTSPSNFSSFYLIISKTNDARGAWWQYKLDMTKDGSTQTSNWSDYESVGITEDKIVLTAQQFTFGTNSYQYPKVRVLDRAALYSGGTLSWVDFAGFAPPSGGDTYDTFVTKCARNLTGGDAVAHLLCVRVNGGNTVTYREVVGPPASPTLTGGTRVSVTTYSAPPGAVQQGTSTLVPTNDCRPPDFVVRNGILVVPFHFGASINSTSVSAIRLLRIRTSDLNLLTDETFGAASTYYYFPCATVDSAGSVYLGFDRSSSTEYPSAWATVRRPSDSAIESSVRLKAGNSYTVQSRWGDYTGIDNDATLSGPGGSTAWYAGQWTKGTNTFGTWVNRLSVTYGQIGGRVVDDCDGSAGTPNDTVAVAGITVSLMQGATTVVSTTTDASGMFNFGYLEAGTYDVVVAPSPGGGNVSAVAGSGGTSQTVMSAGDVQVVITNAQISAGQVFAVASLHAAPATASLSPNFKNTGDPGFTLTVNGAGFTSCSVVRVDGADRVTAFVNSGQLTATIPASDLLTAGARAVTAYTPAPGGGSSSPLYLTVGAAPDTQAPVVSITSPAGGESWGVGSSHPVTWSATDNVVVASVDLALSTDGGATFPTTIASGIPNSGSYAWSVPYLPTTGARVRVIAHDGVGNVGADSSHASFAITGWVVTASAGTNGAISPSGAVVVADGATPSFTITPAAGYHVADVLVNGSSVGAVTSYTFPAVHANAAIAASFAVNQYALNLTVSGSGSVAAVPDQPSYDYGTLVTLTATASGGATFVNWSGDTTASANPLTVVMNQDRNLTATFSAHTYVWNKTASANWLTASNWTPSRSTRNTDDVLIFSGGSSALVANVPTETDGRILVYNNTNVSLQAGVAGRVVTLTGTSGNALDVAAGSTLSLNGASTLTIALPTGTTGSISGTVLVNTNAHRLNAVDAGSLVFKNGSLLQLGTGFTGNVFGTGTGTSGLNSVVFQAGSLLSQVEGSDPFGATAPQTTVVFQPGSRYRLDGSVVPALSGRSYADFEYNTLSGLTPAATSAFSVDSLIVSQGTLTMNATAGGTIRGDIRVKSGTTLNWSPASGTPVFTFGGSTPQRLAIFGTMASTTNAGFTVNNASGLTLASNVQFSGPLAFTSGRITTGSNAVVVASSGSVSGAGAGTGWVAGNLRRNVATGASSVSYDVGDATNYTPVAINFTGVATTFDLVASTHAGDHSSLGSSDLDPARSVNRTWTLTPVGTATLTGADATFNFVASDVDAGANTASFFVRRYSSGWSSPAVGTRTSTSTQATGLTAFGDFAVAEKFTWTITASAGAGGSISPSGSVSVVPGGSQAFLITASPGFHVADVLVDGVTAGAVTGYTFNTVSANHTIAASFAGDAQTLTVNVVGSGSVAKNPDQPTYPQGTSVQLTATPGAGWAFSAWSGDLTGSVNPANVVLDVSKTVTATFADTTAPAVTVTAPNGGETMTEGASVPFTWTASDNAGVAAVTLLLSRHGAGGTYDTLATGLANTGSWNWTVTYPGSTDAWFKVVARDAAGNGGYDVSDGAFTIVATTGVDDALPTVFGLTNVVPNPTHAAGRAVFALPRPARVHVSLLDIQGREVLVLADGDYAAGRHPVAFGAHAPIRTGLYFMRMRVANGPTFTRRVAVAR